MILPWANTFVAFFEPYNCCLVWIRELGKQSINIASKTYTKGKTREEKGRQSCYARRE